MLESPAPTGDVHFEAAAKTKLRGRPAVRISLVKSDKARLILSDPQRWH